MEEPPFSIPQAGVPYKSRYLYHLPPTAVAVKSSDFRQGINAWLNPGTSVEAFVSALSARIGTPNVFLTSSGRLALLVILLTLKQRSTRSKVILPAYSCPTVAGAILEAGLLPVFCDVSPHTLDLDRVFLGRLVDDQVLAIVPTHLYGIAQDVSDLVELGRHQEIFIIEDAAQAFGAAIHGHMVGTSGDFGFYSHGRGKCLPTGHGGIIITKDGFRDDLAKTLQKTIPGKNRRDLLSLARFLIYGLATTPAGWWFIVRSPLNPAHEGMDRSSLSPIHREAPSATQAGIGISIVHRLDEIHAARRRNASLLHDLISAYSFVSIPQTPPQSEPVYLRFPVIAQDKACAIELYARLSNAGIGVSRSYRRTLPDVYSDGLNAARARYPGADRLADCLLTLPSHHLSEDDFQRIKVVFTSI